MEQASSHIAEHAKAQALETIFSSYDYWSPELREGGEPSLAGDFYSLGVMVYEMLTGEIPAGRFPKVSELRSELGTYWDRFIEQCLVLDPRMRYASTTDMINELDTQFKEEVEGVGPPESAQISVESKEKSPKKRKRTTITPKGMVYVPLGDFMVGGKEGGEHALPQHSCTTKGFYIDRTPVTVAQFAEFVKATNYVTEAEKKQCGTMWVKGEWKKMPGLSWKNPMGQKLPEDFTQHPVTQVTYRDAIEYCRWIERRLPLEKEWEYAARGGFSEAIYPWGDKESSMYANFSSSGTTTVMRYHANGYGLYDMGGNVWEWTSSWYLPYPGNMQQSAHFGEKYRVCRGGSWMYDSAHCACSFRHPTLPDLCFPTIGFRTVVDFEPIQQEGKELDRRA